LPARAVEAIGSAPRLLAVNFCPEYRADGMQKSWYRQIPLIPLGPDAIRELLDDLLGTDPSITGLAEAIHPRPSGYPLFTEEIIQSLIGSGHLEGGRGTYRLVTAVDKLQVPSAVQPRLAARIGHLPERVLQTAAVIGRQVSEPVLARAADIIATELAGVLAALKRVEFAYEEALYPVAEWTFEHPLTQEVARRRSRWSGSQSGAAGARRAQP
jgi:predicted ATPase